MLRAQLAVVLGGAAADVSERAREALEARRERFGGAGPACACSQAIGELEPRFRKSGQQQLLVETLLVRFALLDRVGRARGRASLDRRGTRHRDRRAAPRRERDRAPADAARDARVERPPRECRSRRRVRPSAERIATRARALTGLRRSAPTHRRRQRAAAASVRSRPTAALDAASSARRPRDKLIAALGRSSSIACASTASRCWPRALEHASPVAVTADGVVTIELDEANDIYAHAIDNGAGRDRSQRCASGSPASSASTSSRRAAPTCRRPSA